MQYQLCEYRLESAPWQSLEKLIDESFTLPPRDVFERVIASTHRHQRIWIATRDNSEVIGMVMLCPHSKGGHLDNLVVAPQSRGLGVGVALVQCLLRETATLGPGIVSLTTRIPTFFEALGFKHCGRLDDGSFSMILIYSWSSFSKIN